MALDVSTVTNVVLASAAALSLGFMMFQAFRFERKEREKNALFKELVASLQRVAGTYEGEVAGLRAEMAAVKDDVAARKVSTAQTLAIKQQELALKTRKEERENLKQIGKAIGWAVDNL